MKCIREEPFADALKLKNRAVSLPDDGAAAVLSIFDGWVADERTESAAALHRAQTRLADLDTRLNRLLDVYLEGSLTCDEYAARKEQMLRDKADAKERIGQIQTKGAIWLEPSREFVKRANMAETWGFSDDLAGIRDFLKIAGSNLKLTPPETAQKGGGEDARAWPEESLLRQGFGGQAESEPRRGVPHMRAHAPTFRIRKPTPFPSGPHSPCKSRANRIPFASPRPSPRPSARIAVPPHR